LSESEIVGHLGRVVVTRLEPNEDLLQAITNVVRQHNIKAGVVLSITGGLNKAVIQHFIEGQQQIGVIEIPGPLEASGHGIVGWVDAPSIGKNPFGVGRYVDGEPYVHVHITLTSPHETICGHLMEGTTVRSNHGVSHFTIMVAEVSGAALLMKVDGGAEKQYKGRGVYHELVKLSSDPVQ
jgi:predicted DNA-binding protein with PD1-like motif